MFSLTKTEAFDQWLRDLDVDVQARVTVQIRRLERGRSTGNLRSLGANVFVLSIKYCRTYSVYFSRLGDAAFVLLCGGDERSEPGDLEMARRLARDVEEE